jgi:hypothetical protein
MTSIAPAVVLKMAGSRQLMRGDLATTPGFTGSDRPGGRPPFSAVVIFPFNCRFTGSLSLCEFSEEPPD